MAKNSVKMTELPANLTLLEAAVAISRKLLPRPTHLTPGWCAAIASILEATARKPGNVSPDKNFADLSYDDLCNAARAMVPAFDQGKDNFTREHDQGCCHPLTIKDSFECKLRNYYCYFSSRCCEQCHLDILYRQPMQIPEMNSVLLKTH